MVEVCSRDGGEFVGPPGVDGDHQMTREAFHQAAGASVIEAFLAERGRQRTQAGVALRPWQTVRTVAPNTSQSGGSVSAASCGPGQPPATDQAAIDMDGIGPAEA